MACQLDEYIISNHDKSVGFSPPSIIGRLNTGLYTITCPDMVTNERRAGLIAVMNAMVTRAHWVHPGGAHVI